MSLLTKIKYQYNSRILQDLFSSNEYSKFFKHLESHKDNIELYSQLLSNLCSTALLKNEDDIFYKHNGVSLQPVSNNIYISNLRFERDYIYRQTGGIFLSRYQHVLKSKNIFKGRIGSVVLSKNTQFRIKNEFDLKIANLMIKEKIHND